MANQLFSNNGSSLLAADTLIGATTVEVQPGEGALFPAPTGTEFFTAALENTTGDIEIVTCTDVTGDILTVVRAQEGTTEANFLLAVSRIEVRPTAGVLASFLQADEAIFTDDADLNGNSLINGEIVGVPLRGATGDTSNQIVVPPAGDRPTIGGIDILIATDALIPAGLIGLWSGLLVNIPTGWALCDGGSGTPDLSARFVVGYSDGDPNYGVIGNTGGNGTETDPAGIHDHGGTVDSKVLLESDIPTLSITTHSATSNNSSDNHNQTNRAAAGANNSSLSNVTTPVDYINGSPTAHDHDIPEEPDHTHTYTPPYYVLAYIMKL